MGSQVMSIQDLRETIRSSDKLRRQLFYRLFLVTEAGCPSNRPVVREKVLRLQRQLQDLVLLDINY